jgi:hypothetical protein
VGIIGYFWLSEGTNFSCQDPVPISSLSRDLCNIAAFLQDKSPNATLQWFDDWWQHDGLYFENGILDWHDLFAIVESPDRICEAMSDDDYVRIGIATTDGEWYLRFYATLNNKSELFEGDYDVTLASGLVEAFRKIIPSLMASISEEASEKYFKRI